jgi:hypothetical protein
MDHRLHQRDWPNITNSDDACVLAGSEWEVVGDVYRLIKCRAGFVIVRGDLPGADHCFPCPVNKYLADPASYYAAEGEPWLVAATADEAARMCRSSEAGLLCMGGDAVITQEGFWRLEKPVKTRRAQNSTQQNTTKAAAPSHRRAEFSPADSSSATDDMGVRQFVQPSAFKVFRCAVGVCQTNGTCAPGRYGPVCGLCMEGYLHTVSGCVLCPNPTSYAQARPAAIAIIVIFFLLVWFLISWRPLLFDTQRTSTLSGFLRRSTVVPAEELADQVARDGTRPPAQAEQVNVWAHAVTWYLKNGIGFFQLVASLSVTFYEVDWGNLAVILSGSKVFTFDIFFFVDIACLTGGLRFMTKLLIITIVPGIGYLLLGMPPLLTKILGHVYHGGWSAHPRHDAVIASFYYWSHLWLFLMYVPASMVCLSAFHCRLYGDDWVLVSDMREVRLFLRMCWSVCTNLYVQAYTHGLVNILKIIWLK